MRLKNPKIVYEGLHVRVQYGAVCCLPAVEPKHSNCSFHRKEI